MFTLCFIYSCEDIQWDLDKDHPFHENTSFINGELVDSLGVVLVPNMDAPIVSIGDVTAVSANSAQVGGEIVSLGSPDSMSNSLSVNSFGHCWSNNQNPSINDYTTDFGYYNSEGIYSSELENLSPSTEYYVRSYATNAWGTSYSNQLSFTTDALLCDHFSSCSSLTGFSYASYSQASWVNWQVCDNGYSGSCFCSDTGGYIEFSYYTSTPVTMSFWMSAYDVGYWTHNTPVVTVDGQIVDTEIRTGNNIGGDGDDWVERETVVSILQGNHTIKIDFGGGCCYGRYIDEIRFWCR